MSAPAPAYPAGLTLIQTGECPIGAIHPMACWTCPYGHATECHHPMGCEEAQCSHYRADEDAEAPLDEYEADNMGPTGEDLRQAQICAEAEALGIEPEQLEYFEIQRQARIAAGVEHACAGCGCSETRSCPGGCVWANERLCSRCLRKALYRDAAARLHPDQILEGK